MDNQEMKEELKRITLSLSGISGLIFASSPAQIEAADISSLLDLVIQKLIDLYDEY